MKGNSGSPVESNGAAVGVHAKAGCTATGGSNVGTSVLHPPFQAALRRCLGSDCPRAFKVTYGRGCEGTRLRRGAASCSGGSTACFLRSGRGDANQYALLCRERSRREILSIAVRTASVRGTQTGRIEIRESAAGKPGKVLRSVPINVPPSLGLHRSEALLPSLFVEKDQEYFVVLDLDPDIRLPICSSGPFQTTHFVRAPNSTTWVGPQRARWAFRVNCLDASRIRPPLVYSGEPKIGRTLKVDLSGVPGSARVWLNFGVARTDVPIPATNDCRLCCNQLLALPFRAAVAGTMRVEIEIPNAPSLCGATLCNQFYVQDSPPGNSLGIVVSNCGEFRIGT